MGSFENIDQIFQTAEYTIPIVRAHTSIREYLCLILFWDTRQSRRINDVFVDQLTYQVVVIPNLLA